MNLTLKYDKQILSDTAIVKRLFEEKKGKLVPLVMYVFTYGNRVSDSVEVKATLKQIAEKLGTSLSTLHRFKDELVALGVMKVSRGQHNSVWTIETTESVDTTETPVTSKESIVIDTGLGIDLGLDKDLKTLRKNKTLRKKKPTKSKESSISTLIAENGDNLQIVNLDDKSAKSPSIPVWVSETKEIGYKFPYPKAKHIWETAIWYWAKERYAKYGLDFKMTIPIYTKFLGQMKQTLSDIAKNGWESTKDFIDWYLNLSDPFYRKTEFAFDVMVSPHTISKYKNRSIAQGGKMVSGPEQRNGLEGVWLK